MEAGKRKMIVEEIGHWRQNRLLPEQYCDFLLNLYDEKGTEREARIFGLPAAKIRAASARAWLLIIVSTGLFFYFVVHFTSFPLPMQIAVLASALLSCFWIGARERQRRPVLSLACLGAGCLVGPGGGLYLLTLHGAADSAVAAWLAFTALFWMVTGLTSRFAIFHFCGWAAMSLIYGWLLFRTVTSPDWTVLQMSWLPACVVLTWFGWLLQHRKREVGRVLLLAGSLMWFAPELYGSLSAAMDPGLLQLSFVGKLTVAGILLFGTRNHWTEWVA